MSYLIGAATETAAPKPVTASMLDGIASDLLKFASRQLFRSLLSSVFGDGSGGTGSNTGIGGGLSAAIMGAFGVKAAQTQATSAVGTDIGASLIGGVDKASGTAASGIRYRLSLSLSLSRMLPRARQAASGMSRPRSRPCSRAWVPRTRAWPASWATFGRRVVSRQTRSKRRAGPIA